MTSDEPMTDDSDIDIKAGALGGDFITRKYGDDFQCWGVTVQGAVFNSPMNSVAEQLRASAPEGYKLWRVSILFFEDAKKVRDLEGNINLSFDLLGDVPESYLIQLED